jgi:hypothetical protein
VRARTTCALHLLCACAAGMLVVGCAGAGPAQPAASRPPSSPATVSTDAPRDDSATPAAPGTPTPDRPPAGEEDAMISFAVEGGYTGQMRSVTIDPDGEARVDVMGSTARDQLDAAQVDAIVAELDRSALFDRDREYPAPAGADQQRYEITYDGATVVAYDGTVPPELTEAVRLLEAALRDVQP